MVPNLGFFPPMKLNVSSTKSRFLTGLNLTVRSLEIAEEITPLDSIQMTQSSRANGWKTFFNNPAL